MEKEEGGMETCHSGGRAPRPASDWQWDIAGSDKALSKAASSFHRETNSSHLSRALNIAILDTRLLIPLPPPRATVWPRRAFGPVESVPAVCGQLRVVTRELCSENPQWVSGPTCKKRRLDLEPGLLQLWIHRPLPVLFAF